MLGRIPPACVDFVTLWKLYQEDTALTDTHILGFCSFMYVKLIIYGTNNFSWNGPDQPSLKTDKV